MYRENSIGMKLVCHDLGKSWGWGTQSQPPTNQPSTFSPPSESSAADAGLSGRLGLRVLPARGRRRPHPVRHPPLAGDLRLRQTRPALRRRRRHLRRLFHAAVRARRRANGK